MDLTDLGYWLFSAMMQALSAFFAVVGVFVVFKIQLLKQREDQLLGMARAIYEKIKRISTEVDSPRYGGVSLCKVGETIKMFEELIDDKEKVLIDNEGALRNTRDGMWDINIKRIKAELSQCHERLEPLKKIDQELKNIKIAGQDSLKRICNLFILAMFFIFLNPFVSSKIILIFALIIVGFAAVLVKDLSKVIIKSLELGE